MNIHKVLELHSTLKRWNAEYTQVLGEARAVNFSRTRILCPLTMAGSSVLTLIFFWLALNTPENDPTYRWKLWQAYTNACMAITYFFCTIASRSLDKPSREWLKPWLSMFGAICSIAFTTTITAIDQLVTPAITAFYMACMVTSFSIYMRPTAAAVLFGAAAILFVNLIGLTQTNTEMLLSNRINGVLMCVIGLSVSVVMYRKFTTIALQKRQLEQANAELTHKQLELERLTRQDGLTGLFNRNTFVELSTNELRRAKRQGGATTVLLMDLDHFKRVNDTWGHPAGDAVLRHVARTIANSVRSTDLVGRLGGEEFIVLLPNTPAEIGRKIAEKIRQQLALSEVPWENARIALTASIGLAGTAPGEGREFDSLYTEADKALYLAKQRGRNRVM